MTIDEAIAHAREIARQGCAECNRDHEQLAEWLEELKVYKRALRFACSGNNTNPICPTEEYKDCCMSLGSCGECWENMYLQKARENT